MTDLELLDLKLFKVCYPGRYTKNIKGWFTGDIAVCFAVLIPEMNRRGMYLNTYQTLNKFETVAEFGNGMNCAYGNSTDLQPAVAICLAAEKAIDSQGVVASSKTDNTLHK